MNIVNSQTNLILQKDFLILNLSFHHKSWVLLSVSLDLPQTLAEFKPSV